MTKNILLASFISPERLDWFLGHLEDKFNIPREKVFIFQNLDDEYKVIITFKFIIQTDKRVNFNSLFPNAILIHKKGNAIYTINALNKLIEEISDSPISNMYNQFINRISFLRFFLVQSSQIVEGYCV